MEELQRVMAALDFISDKIGDGMYLDMADNLKRIHDKLNGDKPFHEDTFYYSDDDSELGSEDDSDYESPRPAVRAPFAPNLDRRRLSEIARLRDQLLDHVKKMHEEYKVLMKWEKEARRTDWTPIKRMTAFRKSQAIKQWCVKNVRWAPGGEAGELVGCISTAAAFNSWTWKNLMENGLRAVVMEIGTEEEKVPDFVYYDDLSLKTIQKLPAFEKKIHDDYKEECQRKMTEYFNNAKLKVVESKAKMAGFEMFCVDTESELSQLDAPVYCRDYWEFDEDENAPCEFWVGENGRMVDNGFEARVERRR
uniref:Uncharacterized protein n=1 Tax=viral metagenome TaxID=1070528 RepID=A0A6C0CMJ0_9ZZZZ